MKIEVEPVERNGVTGPMRIGIGTEEQFGALYNAGAEEVRSRDLVKKLISEDPIGVSISFRDIDTVIMVQPNILTFEEIKVVSRKGCNFHVPECGDFNLNTDKAIRLFRQLKPEIKGVVRVENRHGKIKYPQPTQDQVETIVGWWRDTTLKRAQVVEKVCVLLGADVPDHWVRDRVKKATGTAARSVE